MDPGSLPDLQRAKAFKQLLARSEALSVTSILWTDTSFYPTMSQLPVLHFPKPGWERRTEVCFTGTAMPKMKQRGPSISEAV